LDCASGSDSIPRFVVRSDGSGSGQVSVVCTGLIRNSGCLPSCSGRLNRSVLLCVCVCPMKVESSRSLAKFYLAKIILTTLR
jgi:hypothetical protein